MYHGLIHKGAQDPVHDGRAIRILAPATHLELQHLGNFAEKLANHPNRRGGVNIFLASCAHVVTLWTVTRYVKRRWKPTWRFSEIEHSFIPI